MQKGKIDFFSVLRGFAILAVIITHIHQIFDLPNYMRVIPKFGQMGCQVYNGKRKLFWQRESFDIQDNGCSFLGNVGQFYHTYFGGIRFVVCVGIDGGYSATIDIHEA